MFKFLDRWLMSSAQRHHELSQELGDKNARTIEAAKLLEEEYASCHLQETKFMVGLPLSLWRMMRLSSGKALQLAEIICREMDSPNIQGVGENLKWQWAEAYYDYRTQNIHCNFPIRIDYFLHELTHHIQSHIDLWEPFRKQHGKKFCEIELKVHDIVLKKGASNG